MPPEIALSPLERQVVEAVVRLVAACPSGFDAPLTARVRDALLTVVDLDGLAVTIDDEGGERFRILWHSMVGDEPSSFVHDGERREHWIVRRSAEPRVVEDAARVDAPLARAAARAGILSYVRVPISYGERELGSLFVAHRVRGAPSQQARALLLEVARVLSPAIVRALTAERQHLMGAVLDAHLDGVIALDPEGDVTEANLRALRLLRRPRASVIGRPLRTLLDEDAFAALLPALVRRAPSEQPSTEVEVGGVTVDVYVTRLAKLPDGSTLLCLRDAEARRAAAQVAARRIEQGAFLRALGEAMAGTPMADAALSRAVDICFVRFELGSLTALREHGDGELRLVASLGANAEMNAKLARMSYQDLLELFSDQFTAPARKRVLVKTGVALPGDGPDDPRRWVMFAPLLHARRRLGGLLVTGHAGDPIPTDLRETWEPIAHTISIALGAAIDFEQVVALEVEKRQLVDNLPVVVARIDPRTGATLFANAALDRVLGVRVEALDALGVEALLADDLEREASRAARSKAAAGVATGWVDRRYRHADGRVLTLRESVYPVRSQTPGVQAVEMIAYDITNEIDARQQLMRQDRLASLGILAAGVAHEINNPVGFIGLAAGQMSRIIEQASRGEVGAQERLRDLAGEVTEAATRIAEIVAELKLFTRIPEGASACPVDVNRMLQTAMTLTAAEVRRHAELEVRLGPLPLAPGAFSSMGHVFANLLINAAQAIEARHERDPGAGGPDVVRVWSGTDAGAIVVRISDTGVGIDDKVLPRIFDPFFKTGSGGQGAGLGLAIAYDIVRRVGGDIRVVSAPRATLFEVVLPLDPALLEPDAPASYPRAPQTPQRSMGPLRRLSALRRVLIIDDERPLVKALARQLAERYDVDVALTATDALAKLSDNAYDAIVCDLRLPERSGPAIYEEIVSRSPEQASRFIFTTGGSFGITSDDPQARAEATGLPLLEKPFDGASFEAAVARVASRPA